MNKIKSFLERILDTCFHEWKETVIYEGIYENNVGDTICVPVSYKVCKRCGKKIKI